jgi:hypothetical protein
MTGCLKNDNRYVKIHQKCPRKVNFITRLESSVEAPPVSITSTKLLGKELERLCIFSHTWQRGDRQMRSEYCSHFWRQNVISPPRRVTFNLQHPNTYIGEQNANDPRDVNQRVRERNSI